jgi:peptidoglycan L-alanyl-D-glutamate endopeptidase CwlK
MASGFKFSKRSLAALKGIHPDLRKVVNLALELSTVDFIVTEGLRSLDRQKHLVAQGASRTLKSRHLTGHAVDVVATLSPGTVSYKVADMRAISRAFKAAAKQLGIPIEWGGDWKTFVDTPHYELDRKVYP